MNTQRLKEGIAWLIIFSSTVAWYYVYSQEVSALFAFCFMVFLNILFIVGMLIDEKVVEKWLQTKYCDVILYVSWAIVFLWALWSLLGFALFTLALI